MAYAVPVQVLHNFCIMMNFCDDCYLITFMDPHEKILTFMNYGWFLFFVLKELPPFDGCLEDCSCSGCWLYCYTEAIWIGICVRKLSCVFINLASVTSLSTDPKTKKYFFLVPPNFICRTCLELAEICRQVDIPPGVLNIVTGLGSEAGAPLASHPHVDKVLLSHSHFIYSKLNEILPLHTPHHWSYLLHLLFCISTKIVMLSYINS